MYLNGYPLLLLLLLFAASMPFALMLLSQVVQVKSPTALKYVAYESGMTPYGDAKIQFDVKFYLYALLFIVFDIETVFLFPWATAFNTALAQGDAMQAAGMGLYFLVEVTIFILILILGLVYAWKKDALRWQ
jgi:NADH:ubiquinone oxidoreductase subunit 3 (subunit A)